MSFGSALMRRPENDMATVGYGMIMTSAQSDETAQHLYRKLGYKDCGGLTFDIPGYAQPLEVFFTKDIRTLTTSVK